MRSPIPRQRQHMTTRLTIVFLVLVSSPGLARGQRPSDGVELHGAAGGAASGGPNTRDNGGLFGKVGMGIRLSSQWQLDVDGNFFARTASSGCVSPSTECTTSFPSTIVALLIDGIHSSSSNMSNARTLRLGAGVGPAMIGSTPTASSLTAFAADIGGDFDLVRRGRGALTAGIHGMVAFNVHGRTLWLVPLTIGARF